MAQSTIGITLAWKAEVTAGTRPTSDYKALPYIIAMPEDSPTPEVIDATPASNTIEDGPLTVSGMPGVPDAGAYTANFDDDFYTAWDELLAAQETAKKSGLQIWFARVHPYISKAFYHPGEALPLGINAVDYNSAHQGSAYILRTGGNVLATKPTVVS
jgi:hypothetical protein